MALQPHIRHKLCDIFFHNVDPLFKILHRPSMQAFLKEDKPYLNYEQDHQAPATLASAVYLAAVCTLDTKDCQALFNTDKKSIVAEFQKESEIALAKADFVTTNDVTVLQAYIISLVSATEIMPPTCRKMITNSHLACCEIPGSKPESVDDVGYGPASGPSIVATHA